MSIIDEARPDPRVDPSGGMVSTALSPIISGFHPDPTICRVGDDYYLAHSSFEYFPAVPLWHSRDLITWQQIGNVLDRPDQFASGSALASEGIFAPTLRFHDGRFWLITTDVADLGGQILVSATDPRGPWSAPVRFPALIGIDPDLAWDDAGCLITYCSTDPAATGIAQARVDPETGESLEAPRLIWQGTGLAFPEAPHLYQRDGWWYLLIAEGGTERGHCVSVARSAHPEGPFEPAPHNPLLTHRSTDLSVQNTGHADFVENADGTWSAVYLGVRPRGVTPLFHVIGRETFLAGVDWVDGWPHIDESRHHHHPQSTSFSDTFADQHLHPRWVSPGESLAQISRSHPEGVQLIASGDSSTRSGAIVARVRDLSWRFEADLVPGLGESAVVVRLDDRHLCEVRLDANGAAAHVRVGALESTPSQVTLSGERCSTVYAESVPSVTHGPDDITMGVVTSNGDHELLRLDGRYLSTEVAGGFTGRVVGVRPVRGETVLAEVRYEGRDDKEVH